MRTVIISDLHNRVNWVEPVLSSLDFDKVIFLGDYFDEFNDTLDSIINSAKWLKQSLSIPGRVHLFGTHDIWYRFPNNPFLQASGNTVINSKAINKILTEKDWKKIKLYHCEQKFLLTHAGLHPYIIGKNDFHQVIRPATEKALLDAEDGKVNPWLDSGFAREGIQPFGGITWLDWNFEFEPIPNLNQIVGHTELKVPEEKSTPNSKNYCMDTRNKHIGIIEDGAFKWMDRPIALS